MNGKLVHLVRHGPPRRTGLLLGHTDEPPADPAGGLRVCVPDSLPVSCVVSSDLLRALAGAETLATMRGVGLCIDPRWRELNFGAWEAVPPDVLLPATLARFWDDPDTYAPPQGERWSCLRNRVAAALADVEDTSLVVTHAGAMRAAVSILTGLDHRQVWAFDLPYGALLSLRIWPGDEPEGQITGLHSGLLK